MAKKDIMNMTEEEIAKLEEELTPKTKTKTAKKDDDRAFVVLPKAYQRWLGPVYAFTLNGKMFALKVDGTKNEIDADYKEWVDDKIARVLQSVQREDKIEQL